MSRRLAPLRGWLNEVSELRQSISGVVKAETWTYIEKVVDCRGQPSVVRLPSQ
jgi:hypothetical protein